MVFTIIVVFLGIDILLGIATLVQERATHKLKKEMLETETELNHAILELNRRMRRIGGK